MTMYTVIEPQAPEPEHSEIVAQIKHLLRNLLEESTFVSPDSFTKKTFSAYTSLQEAAGLADHYFGIAEDQYVPAIAAREWERDEESL